MRLLLAILLFISLSANGQAYNINIKSWGVEDGLSDRQVNNICEDSFGFIWLCTSKGLNRFDGYNFKVYNAEKNILPFDNLSGMVLDNNGCFWIMGSDFYQNNDNNLFIFDPLTGKSISLREKTGYNETFRFNLLQKFNDTTLFFGSSQNPYFFTWSAGRGLHKIKYPVKVTRWLTWSSNNTFWVVDSSNLICEINMYGQLLSQSKHNEDSLYLLPTLAVGSYSLTKAMPGQKNTSKPVTDVEVNQNIARLCMYTSNGQYLPYKLPEKYELGGIMLEDLIAKLEPLHRTYCAHVFIASDNEVWISSGFGLTHITVTKNKFHKYFYHEGKDISYNSFRALLVNDNILYAVNEAEGIYEVNLATGAQQKFSPFRERNMRLFSLTKTRDGRLFGLREADIYIHDKQWLTSAYHQAAPPGITWKITEIGKDSFLTAGWQGLKYYDLKKHRFTNFTKYNAYISLATSLVIDIIDDNDGRKWVCSNSGLYVYDSVRGIIARYSSVDTGTYFLPTADIHHIYRDSADIYWLGTANGLIRWDKIHNKYHLFTIADGLSNNNICAIYGDSRNRLWLTSDYGLMKFDKRSLHVKTYLTNDGISYNEFNRLSHTRDKAGNLYLGTLNGVTAFNPDDFYDDDDMKNARLEVSSFEQFDGNTGKLINKTAELIHTSSITLQPGDRFFNLNLALLTFDEARQNIYYWKIDELNTGWISFKEPTLQLSGLQYGRMTLHIKAQASEGGWAANELLFRINVIKPFYLRNWFLAMVLMLVAAIVFIGHKWRIYRFRKENIRLDSIVKQKTSELEQTISRLEISSQQKDVLMKEIHHRVKNNLQIVSTLLNLQLSNISDEKAKQSLEESVSRISSIALVHFQLYHKEDLTGIELSGFIYELLQQILSVYLKRGQKVHLQNDVTETWLDIDTALPLGLVLNELMTNSFKYAYKHQKEGRMKIELEQADDTLTLRYYDYGPGFPESYDLKTNKSLGITLIKSLTRQIGGNFSYNREDNCFLVTFLDTHTRKNIA
ncbi:sensor histidine kinase [Chitinophaga sp. CF418]|uniref:sensor histidine kinase n=1 Tax=Chitinophaga sp. CF418 TaxID=1855287 RepID=UPI00090F0F79|nr:sensor histidine kinase [Chitinophaga sp. CF418]SHL96913.1 Two-component sensor histidine kinase, contains HisKA and HATPase domains [Chitinophaga sp. CF418]